MVAAKQLRDCKVRFLFFFRLFFVLCACVRCVLGVAALSVINRSQCVSCDFDRRRFGCFFFPRKRSWKCVEMCLRCEWERCVLGDKHRRSALWMAARGRKPGEHWRLPVPSAG
ncbi:unnamed protein product [Sphagnum jensenii]|uniref:Secreted protein n=1 Tax=Sphagnum jensenii TaxID=128206 RepID=A0ABP1BYX2_9BRYO